MTPDPVLPPTVRRYVLPAVVLVVAEGLAMIALALADVSDLTGDRIGLGIGVAAFLGAYGAGQIIGAVLLLRGRGGARGPLVLTQLIQLGLAWNLRDAEFGDASLPWVAWLLAGTAVVVLLCLLSGPVNRHFEHVWVDDGESHGDAPRGGEDGRV